MSTFSEITNNLQKAKEAGIIGYYSSGISKLMITEPSATLSGGNQWIDWIVYPTETVFDSSRLNQILLDLCPIQVLPSAMTQFENRGFRMDFGYLKWFQNIGRAKYTVTTEVEVNDKAGLIKKIDPIIQSSSTELNRRLMVYILPNQEIAEILYPTDNNSDSWKEFPTGLSKSGMGGEYYEQFMAKANQVDEKPNLISRFRKMFSKAA